MAFTEDFAPFFADFGVTATPVTGSAFTVIFDRAHLESLGISSLQPMCVAKTSDVSGLAANAQLTIGGAAYLVRDSQADGTGISTLMLEAA